MAKKMTNKEINDAFEDIKAEFEQFKKDYKNFRDFLEGKIDNQFNEFKELGNDKINKLDEKLENLTNTQQDIENYYHKLFEQENSIQNRINKLKKEIESYHTKLFEGDEKSTAIKDNISDIYTEIKNYQKELFGYKEKDKNGQTIEHAGIKDDIEELKERYEKELKDFDSRTEELIDKKTEKMDSLLDKMDINYNAVEQEALSKKFFALSGEKSKTIQWTTLLLSLYSLILTAALIFLFTCEPLRELFAEIHIIAGALIRIAITVPIMYLIVVTSSRLKRELTIRDQYNFKGSIMSSYRNISTHIKNEEIGISEGKQTELLENVFNIILENEADKIEMSHKSNIEEFNQLLDRISKEFGEDKQKLITILYELTQRMKKRPSEKTDNKQKDQ